MISEFMWIPHGKPIPEGWSVVEQAFCHHHYWSVLIMRTIAEQPNTARLHATGAGNSAWQQEKSEND